MTVTVVEREPMTVVGWERKFVSIFSPDATSASVIGDLWANAFQHDVVSRLPGSLGHPTWGVIWADPPAQRSHPDELHYLAGLPFSTVPPLPAGMSARTVPGGPYATITHRGPLSGLRDTIARVQAWSTEHGYEEHSDWHDLERYDERFFRPGPEQEFDYFISLRPIAGRRA
jgi:AraC family transcriptional regulator